MTNVFLKNSHIKKKPSLRVKLTEGTKTRIYYLNYTN